MYPRAHSRLTILGDAYGQQEIWQTGVRLDGTDEPTAADFEAIDLAVQTFLGTTSVAFPSAFRYTGLKWAPQDQQGRYGDAGESTEWLRAVPFVGPFGGGYPQLAIVTSLRTARSRGYASNGRMYWPSGAGISSTSGRLTSDNGDVIASACATLIGAINARGLGAVSVMSTVGAGRIEAVTGVRVGQVMDTQRRRRNGIPEDYTDLAAVPS